MKCLFKAITDLKSKYLFYFGEEKLTLIYTVIISELLFIAE